MIKARILVVEDEAIIARDLSHMLGKLGHTVVDTVMTGEEAVDRATVLKPDLVLMDIRLAGKMDGIDAVIQIHKVVDAPAMFITGNTDEATLERAKAASPIGYLPKPIQERELRVWVEMGLHRAVMERRVKECDRYLISVLSAVGDAVIATDAQRNVREFNPAAEALTGWLAGEALGKPLTEVLQIVGCDGAELQNDPVSMSMEVTVRREWNGDHCLKRKDGTRVPLAFTSSRIACPDGSGNGLVLAIRDISDKKAFELERERLVTELRAAVDKVKTLRGLVPICASCKKIRDDRGFWRGVEEYVEAHSHACFSHGMCPECIRQYYPEYAERILTKPEKADEE